MLDALLEVFGQSVSTRVGEYFRGTEFESAVSEIEASVLTRPEADFEAAALEEQFISSWKNLQSAIGFGSTRVPALELQEKLSRKQNLSP